MTPSQPAARSAFTAAFTAALATTLLLGLSACGKKEGSPAATQVAAKVGSEEISVHQINQVLSRTNTAGTTPQAVQAMSREVLEKLIDQQLTIDNAIDAKLHRTPDVVAQIEAARREILSRAYLQRFTAGLPKPTSEEAKKYFAENPQLFSQRRIFNVQELIVPNATAVLEPLRSMTASGKPIEEIATFLQGKSVEFKAGSATRAAEQVPLEILAKVHALKDGQTTVIESGQGATVLHLVASQSVPVPEAAALPRIEQFLGNQRANDAVTAHLKQLRADSKITYLGEFATPLKEATKDASITPATPDAAPNQAPALAKPAQTAIEKGVAGLK